MNTITVRSIRFAGLFLSIALLLGAVLLSRTAARPALASLGHLAGEAGRITTASQRLASQAGTPALLLLHANALVLATGGDTTTLMAQVLDAGGTPMPGVEVRFSADLGGVAPASTVTDANGVATASFTAAGTQGQAFVIAEVDGLIREAAIQVVKPNSNATTHALTLDLASEALAPGQQMNVTAVLRDAAGQPVSGELVSLFGALGEVSPASALSDANGRVSAAYRAGSVPGDARITGLAGYASASAVVTIAGVATPTPTATSTPTVTPTPTVTTEPAVQPSLYLPLVSGNR